MTDILESFDGLSVWDELVVRPDLVACGNYHIGVVGPMAKLAGQTVRIANFEKCFFCDHPTVVIDNEDIGPNSGNRCYWTADLFLAQRPAGIDVDELEFDDLFG